MTLTHPDYGSATFKTKGDTFIIISFDKRSNEVDVYKDVKSSDALHHINTALSLGYTLL